MTEQVDVPRCLNCGAELTGRYCADCGQEGRAPIPALASWVREAADELLFAEARLPESLKRLITTPGYLTGEWWEGRRARWVSPLRLYLLAAVPFFLLLSVADQWTPLKDSDEDLGFTGLAISGLLLREALDPEEMPLPPPSLTSEERTQWVAEYQSAAAARDSTASSAERRVLTALPRVIEYLPGLIGLIMVPLFAYILRESAEQKLPYIAYVVLSLHVHAAVYLLGIVGVLLGFAAPAVGAIGAGHLYLSRRRLMRESRLRAAVVTFILVFFYAVYFSLVYVGGGYVLTRLA